MSTPVLQASPTAAATQGVISPRMLTAALIVLVVRTRLPFFRTRPGKGLLWATCSIVPIVFLLPYSPLAAPLGLGPLPAGLLAAVVGIIAAYFLSAELVKRLFYRSARRA